MISCCKLITNNLTQSQINMSFNYRERISILEFYDKYGLNPALDFVRHQGVSISQATLYRWLGVRKKAKASYGGISVSESLCPKSTRPHKHRSSSCPSVYVGFIKLVRKKRFGIGKSKLAKMIELARNDIVYAVELSMEYSVGGNSRDMNLFGLPSVSPSTVGRIISSLKKQRAIVRNAKEYNKQKLVYLHGGTGMIKCRKPKDKSLLYGQKKKRRPQGYKPSMVGDQIQLDAVMTRFH